MSTLSIIIPCYNEESTLSLCVSRVLEIADKDLELDIIIVDDNSQDRSYQIASEIHDQHTNVRVVQHDTNQGKGAALRTGFQYARGDFVAIQDADLEYDPWDMKQLLMPLIQGKADVVFGSRFLSSGAHRVFHFWHYVGNKLLTLLSNMLTDLNLTDMETCYKVFRRNVIQGIDIKENRFGFEPEIVAKVAHLRLRIYEMGISYAGRSYSDGKKIGVKDGFRALYCIVKYNGHKVSIALQFLIYLFIGGVAGIVNLVLFSVLFYQGITVGFAVPLAFIVAAVLNYWLCISLLFRHRVRWERHTEMALYVVIVGIMCSVDLVLTKQFLATGFGPLASKAIASACAVLANFLLRKFILFPEKTSGDWKSS